MVNVNDPPTLEGPPGPLDTFAIGSSSTGDKDGVGDNDNDSSSSSSEESDELFVEGFQLTDLDRDVDVVKVLVSCSYGFLDLNPDGLNNVDFNSYAAKATTVISFRHNIAQYHYAFFALASQLACKASM